jgi:ABC-type proline/glycine betaine transport system ATPase subunit
VLLDEPLANLDAARKHDLLIFFCELFAERQTTVLYVTHDLREAALLGQRVIVLEEGKIVQEGPFATLKSAPASPFVQALIDDLEWRDDMSL